MAELLLTDLIDIELLQKIQDEFSKYTGVAALTTDAEGNPITKGSASTDFCMKYTRGSALGFQRCVECDRRAALMALEKGEPVVYLCHTGLADFASPIMLGDRLLGCFLGGQVRMSSEIDEAALKKMADELGVEYESYHNALKEISVMDKKELEKSAKFLGVVAGVLSEMAYQSYISIDKYRSLERAARSQSHFLMDLSSDLRENMTEWITSLQNGVKNGNTESVMNVVDTMLMKGTTTYSIIGDIVDYIKFSDGNVALYETTYSVGDVVQAVVELEQDEAKEKKVNLTYRIAENVPKYLLGDSGRIGQMLSKLLANAVQFKRNPAVETDMQIRVSARKESYAHVLEISLCDKGTFFPEHVLKRFQDYFSRGILHWNEREENGDFSLSIVDLFVRQMHGKVFVTSNKEEGTVFLIELPQLEVSES